MSDTKRRLRWKTAAAGAALAATGVVAGGVLAGTLTASAADSGTGSSAGSSPAAPAVPGTPPAGGAVDETRSLRPDETLLAGDDATKARAAALAQYPGATIQRVETDSDGVYEAHLVTADGQRVTVEMDKDFAVTGTEQGGRH